MAEWLPLVTGSVPSSCRMDWDCSIAILAGAETTLTSLNNTGMEASESWAMVEMWMYASVLLTDQEQHPNNFIRLGGICNPHDQAVAKQWKLKVTLLNVTVISDGLLTFSTDSRHYPRPFPMPPWIVKDVHSI